MPLNVNRPIRRKETIGLATPLTNGNSMRTTARNTIWQASQPLVACNIYVSAGGLPSHPSKLLHLLQYAQDRQFDTNDHTSGITTDGEQRSHAVLGQLGRSLAVVHAFADPVYNRSSFHLAGTFQNVASLAAQVALQALKEFQLEGEEDESWPGLPKKDSHGSHHHPTVGLVDHVSFMPLIGVDNNVADGFLPELGPSTASGKAAHLVGQQLKDKGGIHVEYYGSAHPQGTSLATVRREKTQFFQSGGLMVEDDSASNRITSSIAIVGAPSNFVENYNIRLSCDKKKAQSLTKLLRERDGGLVGVEALTLPYSKGRWEVACNLLQPTVTSAENIQEAVDAWQADEEKQFVSTEGSSRLLVEQGYRVGTTAEQCLACLKLDRDEAVHHDHEVRRRFSSYLNKRSSE